MEKLKTAKRLNSVAITFIILRKLLALALSVTIIKSIRPSKKAKTVKIRY